MKKLIFLLLFAVPLFSQDKPKDGRFQIFFQPLTDAGFTVTILLDTQTGEAWQLARVDSTTMWNDAAKRYLTMYDRHYVWARIWFYDEVDENPPGELKLPPSAKLSKKTGY